ncbi:RNA polymerase subunit sigma [Myxococcus sp. AM001]|nr:RNA polymerase subunit sigma [Myxococcus sp. AM001]
MADSADPKYLDKRTAERYVRSGQLGEAEYERHLQGLPDVADKSVPVETHMLDDDADDFDDDEDDFDDEDEDQDDEDDDTSDDSDEAETSAAAESTDGDAAEAGSDDDEAEGDEGAAADTTSNETPDDEGPVSA